MYLIIIIIIIHVNKSVIVLIGHDCRSILLQMARQISTMSYLNVEQDSSCFTGEGNPYVQFIDDIYPDSTRAVCANSTVPEVPPFLW